MAIVDFVGEQAARRPDAEAVVWPSGSLTYAELFRDVRRLATELIASGIGPGDRVVIFLDNDPAAIIAIYAVNAAGAAFSLVGATTKAERLAWLAADAEPRALITDARRLPVVLSLDANETSVERLIVVGGAPALGLSAAWQARATTFEMGSSEQHAGSLPEPRPAGADALAALLYTSGSSGTPKGVMLTNANVDSATEIIGEYLSLDASDRLFCVLPVSFGYGLTQVLTAARAGATLILEKGFVFPHATMTRLASSQATGLAIVPTIANIILNLDLTKYDLSALRYITNAGAGLPAARVLAMLDALPHVDLVCMYGQTECFRISYMDPAEIRNRPRSVGRGMPRQFARVLREDDSPAAPGEVGELVVAGPHVMQGYWRNEDATRSKLRPTPRALSEPEPCPFDRALYTGDKFQVDEDGYFYFVGRSDDIIKSRGEKVSPYEVESAIMALGGVRDVAVIGVPDPILDRAIKAFVVPVEGAQLDENAVRRHCQSTLEEFMVPKLVEIVSELPKNERGKILRRELEQRESKRATEGAAGVSR